MFYGLSIVLILPISSRERQTKPRISHLRQFHVRNGYDHFPQFTFAHHITFTRYLQAKSAILQKIPRYQDTKIPRGQSCFDSAQKERASEISQDSIFPLRISTFKTIILLFSTKYSFEAQVRTCHNCPAQTSLWRCHKNMACSRTEHSGVANTLASTIPLPSRSIQLRNVRSSDPSRYSFSFLISHQRGKI